MPAIVQQKMTSRTFQLKRLLYPFIFSLFNKYNILVLLLTRVDKSRSLNEN
jgi:hypothetical protein